MSSSSNGKEKKQQFEECGLVRQMFSWSLKDVFNRNLFKDKVKKVPKSFTSI